jgi:dTMP kinase
VPFITLEGVEGCGKSTQASRLGEAFGPGAVLTQEPGGTDLGRSIRSLLLEKESAAVSARAELLLYFADRAQHVAEVIRPALLADCVVVCDRFTDSSLAYQGHGRGLPLAEIRAVAQAATGGLVPDLTLLLDLPVEVGLERARNRGAHDRLESEVQAFHERVRSGYLEMARAEPERWIVIEAEAESELVSSRVLEAVARRGFLTRIERGVR